MTRCRWWSLLIVFEFREEHGLVCKGNIAIAIEARSVVRHECDVRGCVCVQVCGPEWGGGARTVSVTV